MSDDIKPTIEPITEPVKVDYDRFDLIEQYHVKLQDLNGQPIFVVSPDHQKLNELAVKLTYLWQRSTQYVSEIMYYQGIIAKVTSETTVDRATRRIEELSVFLRDVSKQRSETVNELMDVCAKILQNEQLKNEQLKHQQSNSDDHLI